MKRTLAWLMLTGVFLYNRTNPARREGNSQRAAKPVGLDRRN
ncbi:MAG: hypothetical protein WC952_15055 [Desulfobulbaceae bacterium]